MCLKTRRQEWTIRLLEEYKASKTGIFLTLTYEDKNTTGNVSKEDLQKFFKRLRKKINEKIKYYAVGEYGTKTYRPHYHAIIMGLSSNDYSTIDSSWSLGNILIGDVNEKSISYVCKYHVNKTDYPAGLTPSFCLMSKGIGLKYVEKMIEYHAESVERCYYSNFQFKQKLPRYIKDKVYTSKQKEEIQKNIVLRESNLNAMNKWLETHPNSNYFLDVQARYKEYQRQFKQKSNEKNTF